MRLLISYVDRGGNMTDREISELTRSWDPSEIQAFCHLRNEYRTFSTLGIISAIDVATGEELDDLAACFELPCGERIPLVGGFIAAVKALKFFCLQVRQKRGFGEKERKKIIVFIERNDQYQVVQGNPDQWLKKLWDVGDAYNPQDKTYQNNLLCIPAHLRKECRMAAINIAKGSGRVPITEEVMQRIDMEYPADGSAGKQMPGQALQHSGYGLRISLR